MTSSNRAPPSRFKEGEIVAGKYRIERVLGAGGMGVVVAAEHLQLRQRVAIKLLLPDASVGVDTFARFAREAQAAARIQSEHVARVIDVAALEDGSPYMVMEFLEGQDLGQVLAARGPLPVEEAVGYVLQACEGVAEAHAAGIIHRDLKPSNLFVCQRGGGRTIVKVLDFGISKAPAVSAPGGGDMHLTKTGAVMGSPLYMSPEQMASAKYVDARTDVWSLGVTLFELLSGKTPFRGDSMTELIAAVLQTEPMSVRDVRPELPSSIAPAIARALEKDLGRRYASVAELAAAIAPFGPRHAAVTAERVARALGSVPPKAATPDSRPFDRTLESPKGPSPVPGGLAHQATVEAVSAPVVPVGGSTTAQPVSSQGATPGRSTGPGSGARRSALLVAGALALLGVGGAAAIKMKSRGAPVSATADPAPPPVATGSARG